MNSLFKKIKLKKTLDEKVGMDEDTCINTNTAVNALDIFPA